MNRTEQNHVNTLCMDARTSALDEFEKTARTIDGVDVKRLRTCSADVYTTANYFILRSYSTIIAVIDRNTDILYDFLRIVYGYTATSAQHIAKFNHDYCQGKWSCKERLIAR